MRYIAVKHIWWMHHIEWKIKELDAVSINDASVLARAWNDETNKPFSHSQVTVLELVDTEHLSQKGQKLTFNKLVMPFRWQRRIFWNNTAKRKSGDVRHVTELTQKPVCDAGEQLACATGGTLLQVGRTNRSCERKKNHGHVPEIIGVRLGWGHNGLRLTGGVSAPSSRLLSAIGGKGNYAEIHDRP